eukprot:CAMPEP_0168485780 /NCGR_PEP_ID=MMETSP0228-20121227/66787_1 /TAXON_ID=133427 /ORGANISM="Protoceratium reticulatum, Strain CCCM 535 (=CCMP 1889)" /LENGTH=82 /DNA_ID=CAMNT_0008502357 /DNA_START=141 /DNA_END=385 /DNA_ORIENTATION=-
MTAGAGFASEPLAELAAVPLPAHRCFRSTPCCQTGLRSASWTTSGSSSLSSPPPPSTCITNSAVTVTLILKRPRCGGRSLSP